MRYGIMAAAFLMAMAIDAGTSAHAAKWCARYNDGSTNCGFHTRWSCQESVSGAGGICSINPHWRGYDREPRRRRRDYD